MFSSFVCLCVCLFVSNCLLVCVIAYVLFVRVFGWCVCVFVYLFMCLCACVFVCVLLGTCLCDCVHIVFSSYLFV